MAISNQQMHICEQLNEQSTVQNPCTTQKLTPPNLPAGYFLVNSRLGSKCTIQAISGMNHYFSPKSYQKCKIVVKMAISNQQLHICEQLNEQSTVQNPCTTLKLTPPNLPAGYFLVNSRLGSKCTIQAISGLKDYFSPKSYQKCKIVVKMVISNQQLHICEQLNEQSTLQITCNTQKLPPPNLPAGFFLVNSRLGSKCSIRAISG